LRTSTSLFLIAISLACSVGAAAAQYYPPPPEAYPPPPPGAYPPPPAAYPAPAYSPGPYSQAPVPPDAGPPPERPYFANDSGLTPQPLPSLGGQPALRPPADVVGSATPPDVTGSVRAPSAAGASVNQPNRTAVIAALPPEDQPEAGPAQLPPQFRRQLVSYSSSEPAGTIIIDTPNTYLYLVLGPGKALRYGIGVGREGFTWAGSERISRMGEWPDWHPPKEMIERQPYLPRFMAGGEGNPLGARALYLGNTLYRIHGTNQPSTIGTFVSSGCIRLTNEDVEDLYSRVSVGTRVVVLPGAGSASASAATHIPIAR
jgi:lipoprotein-anchoring transpeptidase ErfK/SrfK